MQQLRTGLHRQVWRLRLVRRHLSGQLRGSADLRRRRDSERLRLYPELCREVRRGVGRMHGHLSQSVQRTRDVRRGRLHMQHGVCRPVVQLVRGRLYRLSDLHRRPLPA